MLSLEKENDILQNFAKTRPVVLEMKDSLAVVTAVRLKLVKRFDERAHLGDLFSHMYPWLISRIKIRSHNTRQALSCRRSLGTDSTDILHNLPFSLKLINLCNLRSK